MCRAPTSPPRSWTEGVTHGNEGHRRNLGQGHTGSHGSQAGADGAVDEAGEVAGTPALWSPGSQARRAARALGTPSESDLGELPPGCLVASSSGCRFSSSRSIRLRRSVT